MTDICKKCGKPIPDGETTVVTGDGNYCFNCKYPQTAVCSRCGAYGTKDKPLVVIGDDEDRVSGCCHAKIVLRGVV